jgi:predicted SprT family Zn-dependent metalloprotease
LTPDHWVLLDTILHEIAHAIHFEETGDSDHSEGWKRVCVRIGANPKRLNTNAVMPTVATRKVSHNRANVFVD